MAQHIPLHGINTDTDTIAISFTIAGSLVHLVTP